MPFFTFRQNNSGGSFVENDKIGTYVIVEADTTETANKRALEEGIYFNGVREGRDCKCCGDRWCRVDEWSDTGAVPTIYGQPLEQWLYFDERLPRESTIRVYYEDGRLARYTKRLKKTVEER